MVTARLVALVLASMLAVYPWRRLPAWIGPTVLATAGLVVGIVPLGTARAATDDLAGAIAFLLLAVPLAVLLDETGFFAALAALVDGRRHVIAGLWALAAVVTIVFNLDAAVVLLTPLYVRIAQRRGEDPVLLGFIPALLASLASSVLPVSNLTNLIVSDHFGLTTGAFIAHLGVPSLAAIGVGAWAFARTRGDVADVVDSGPATPVDRDALMAGLPVVAWLLFGFTLGPQFGVPAWAVAAIALVGLMARQRSVPWRHVPFQAALLAAGLGVLATAAAQYIPIEKVIALPGTSGILATVAATAVGSNAVNNLPALLVTLPSLDQHADRVWPVLLGVNLGPTMWVTGALSTLLWQATMGRLGHPVSARTYASTAVRVGVPALAAAVGAYLVMAAFVA